jgi:cytoskeletal protein CcmA (bactofilin family)
MWDRNKPGPGPQSGSNFPPAGSPPAAARGPEPATKGTAIGSAISIIGDIYSEEDLYIDGEVRGTLEIKDSRVTIGPNAKAESNIKAREVIILGQVQGDIDAAQKITIRKAGSLVGNIKTTGIVIDDDAYFKGSIDIVRKQ